MVRIDSMRAASDYRAVVAESAAAKSAADANEANRNRAGG